HHTAIADTLTDAGIDPRSDRCVFLDVDAMLASFLRGGVADRDRFRTTVGGVLDEHLDAGREVRVYVELAGRLWERGEVPAAMQVEELADELARDRSFVLLCAYPTHLFGEQQTDVGGLATVCDAHTGLIHGDRSGADGQAGRAHLAATLQQQVVARAIDHQLVRDERDALRTALQAAANPPRQEFTAMVVHDLRTPTTVIAGLTGVLQQRMAELEPARVADFLATILRNTERIERLLDDILTAAQLESDGFHYDLAPVDVRAVAAEVATAVHQIRGRVVDVSADPDLPLAVADADRQVQVMHNLLSNAAKFSEAGTPISLRIEHHDDHLAVHVRDHGRGIATGDLDRLFEPFARLDRNEADKIGGTGLGLYVTKMLVEGQGGTIDIDSTPGQGTTVTYTIPATDMAQDHRGPAAVPDMPVPEDRPLAPSTAVGRPPAAQRPGSPTRSADARTESELLEQLAEIAHRLSEADDVDDLLQSIVDLGEDYLDGCDGVSLMLIGKNRTISTPAYSSRVAYESDLAQYEADEGPCLDALRDHAVYLIDDLETEKRWPQYRALALKLGVRSMLSYRLHAKGQTYGALDFYSKRPHVYSPSSKVIGQVFASHAGVALKGAIAETGLERAIQTRDTIGQAKGILVERLHLRPAEAFARLAELSQQHNTPLRDLAEQIVATGDIPD
ncbi:MAG: ANTAR domain-containing protein, partial [Intrasporangiaceae bacterium]|nr:ANTAR domain-containing protein [Intrasporangiaceae bacterium]